eukprot:gene26334-biopygen11283
MEHHDIIACTAQRNSMQHEIANEASKAAVSWATAKRSGVSFFEPDPTLFDAVHKEMRGIAGDEAMFSITVPNVDLPVDLGFTQDFDLKLAIGDDGDVVVCGRHWTLFTTVTQSMADFESAYGILQQTAMVSCAAAAAAEPPPLDIDDSCMPFDKLTYAVVVALEELVDNSCCPNTRVFAWLYAKHLRAADMDFMDLLQTSAIANMASTALDAWFVQHPMFRAQAHEAQDLLITVLDDYTPSRPRYEPYWDFDLKLAIGDDGLCSPLSPSPWQTLRRQDAMLIPDVIKDNWYKGDYGLGQVAHFLLKGSVKKTGAGHGGYYIFEEDTCQWVKVDGGRVKSVAVEAMEAALRDVDAWISTSMMVADLDLKRREVLRLIRYTRSHRGVTNVMAFAGPMLRDETFEQGLNIIMVGGGNDTDDDDDDDPSSITEDFLAEKFMEATPEFFSRIKFVPDFKKDECVGDMYYCNPATNRWSNCSNMRIIKVIATELKSKFPAEKNNKTNEKIQGFVDTVRGRKTFLQSVASLVLDETFADNLDNNPDLFVLNNGVFDSLSRDTVVFRNVEMTDNISRCAKWDYQGEDNHHLKRCKEELDDFSRKVMPVNEERDVVLAFFAGILSGRRKEKKFLAFTDKTSGLEVGTVNVNYSSDIDVNLNFNGEILHNDLDRIVLIFKSINDYHYQRFKRNFTDMFDINIYGSHFGMLNNPKSAKSKGEIDLISNDPQQRLFAMGRKDLTESMYVDSMLDNTGFIVSNLRKKHVCTKEVSPYTTVLRVAKYMERVLDAYMLCRHKELAKIPPGDLINRMNININTNQIKKTSTLEEQDAITKLVQIIETATKQKEDFDKATRDFYTVYDKLKIAIMEACNTGPKLCGTVNSAIKPQKKNS